MKKNLKNLLKNFNDFFEQEPSAKMQSWSLLNDFYHLLLTYMSKNDITQTKLAEKLEVSRSAISQLFNRQPNITLNKISEISNKIGLKLKLTSEQIEQPRVEKKIVISYKPSFVNWSEIVDIPLKEKEKVSIPHEKGIIISQFNMDYETTEHNYH